MSKSSEQNATKRALVVLLLLIVLGFGSCIVYLGYLQVAHGEEYRAKAENNQLYDSEISAERGIIYDRNGKELAKSASAWKVVIYPNKIDDDILRENIVKRLASLLDMEEETVMDKAKLSEYGNIVVKYRIEKDLRDKVLGFMDEEYKYSEDKKVKYRKFIGIESDVKRYYPYNSFASTIIGFTDDDANGVGGLELQYNSTLTGTPGRKITAVNGSGSNDSMPTEYESVYDAVQGTSLVTTLDETIQRYLEEGLSRAVIDTKAKNAYGVIMDVNTGAILGMSSMPDYDLNQPYTISDLVKKKQIDEIKDKNEKSEAMMNARYSQWRNRTIADSYEPGSVFKIITAAAALEENTWDMSKTYTCVGNIKVDDKTIKCSHVYGHGTQTFAQAFANSCNPFFIKLGLDMGVDKFFKYFEAFGFTEKTGVDLPAESSPVADITYHSKDSMKKTRVQLASSAFGQTFQASPIQIITAVSAIANGGNLMKPYIVEKTLDENKNVISETKPTVKRQVVSKSTATAITKMMEDVVTSGTGKNAYVAGYRVAGKTGTSEKLGTGKAGAYVASFVCFAPADNPQVAMLIAVDEPVGEYYGSQVAAPVASEIMQKTMVYLNVEPNYTDEEASFIECNAENVVGYEVSTAKATLTKAGFNVKVIGNGKNVIEQVPSSSQTLSSNGTVILYTENSGKKLITTVPDFTNMTVTQVYKAANNANLNVSVVGNALGSNFIAYRQSVQSNEKTYYGDTVTVFFKSTVAESD